jgi:hypothetical protein
MTALHTLIRRLDMFLQGNETTTQQVTQDVTLRTGWFDSLCTALHTLIRRLDMFLQGNEITTQEVTLKTGSFDNHFTYENLESITGGSNLYSTKEMRVTIKYKINHTKKEMEIINVTYPNGKTTAYQSAPSTDKKRLWYTLTTASKDIELPFFASDTFDITPRYGDHSSRIRFSAPE